MWGRGHIGPLKSASLYLYEINEHNINYQWCSGCFGGIISGPARGDPFEYRCQTDHPKSLDILLYFSIIPRDPSFTIHSVLKKTKKNWTAFWGA